MILKIDSLTPKQFSSLTNFLASTDNVLGDAHVINHWEVNEKHPATFARLVKSQCADAGGHNVVLELVEEYERLETEEEAKARAHFPGVSTRQMKKQPVLARYLFHLVRAAGLFPET